MIHNGSIYKVKAGGVIHIEAVPSFNALDKISIAKSVIARLLADKRYKSIPALSMMVEPL